MNANLVYCIECGEVVELLNDPIFGLLHDAARPVYNEIGQPIGTDQEDCLFPSGIAYCPPPELEPDWENHVVEPGKFLPDQYSQYDLELELKQELAV